MISVSSQLDGLVADNDEAKSSLATEAKVMKAIGYHQNVLGLLGTCAQDGENYHTLRSLVLDLYVYLSMCMYIKSGVSVCVQCPTTTLLYSGCMLVQVHCG